MDNNFKKLNYETKKELPLLIIVILPFIYLAYIWNDLPKKVPIHWNGEGEIDGYGDKVSLILIPILLSLLTYVILILIPIIDPKGKIKNMGEKYESIKFILIFFMSFLALFILYSSHSQTITNPNILFILIGFLFVFLGNYMKTIKPNYFIGIRTPWTLENETVWKRTHKLAGIMWFLAGILIIILSLILGKRLNRILFIVITCIISIVPIIYSYIQFKKQKIS
ncbi:SdpI family protein [Yeosuana sp.]|uniref:SdpI family protein n=1 Tax=Yeosuana sp. TaxID=2529388 RepID=UPI004054ED89